MNNVAKFKTPEALTMSSREIAEITGKDHKNVIRDIRAMLDEIQDGSDLSHVQETKDSRGYTKEFRLPKDLTFTLVLGYDVKRRYAVTRRWLELEEGRALPAATVTDLSQAVRSQVGGIVKGIIHKEIAAAIAETLPALVHGELAKHQMMLRRGERAGQVWRRWGLETKGMRGAANWLGNRLAAYGCQMSGRGDVGDKAVRLFDPDKCDAVKAALIVECEAYINKRLKRGVQGNLFRLVPATSESAAQG